MWFYYREIYPKDADRMANSGDTEQDPDQTAHDLGLLYAVQACLSEKLGVISIITLKEFEQQHDKTNKVACATSENSDQPSCSLIRVFAVLSMGTKHLRFLHADSKDWSDWADAQADLSLCWAHTSVCWFCHVVAHVDVAFKRPRRRWICSGILFTKKLETKNIFFSIKYSDVSIRQNSSYLQVLFIHIVQDLGKLGVFPFLK